MAEESSVKSRRQTVVDVVDVAVVVDVVVVGDVVDVGVVDDVDVDRDRITASTTPECCRHQERCHPHDDNIDIACRRRRRRRRRRR